MATATKSQKLVHDAAQVEHALHHAGEYQHVLVRAKRGHLVVYTGDDQWPVARLTPLGDGPYGLAFYRHTGRWEPMPFSGRLDDMARTMATVLASYLGRQPVVG